MPIVGAVSMDSTTVNLGDNPATIGDQVVIFGPELGVESFARATGTIPYEILARIGERVERKFDSGYWGRSCDWLASVAQIS